MARRPTVGTAPPPTSTSHTSQHAHVMHQAAHGSAGKVKSPKAHKMHKASRSMRDSLSRLPNPDVWKSVGRAKGQR